MNFIASKYVSLLVKFWKLCNFLSFSEGSVFYEIWMQTMIVTKIYNYLSQFL